MNSTDIILLYLYVSMLFYSISSVANPRTTALARSKSVLKDFVSDSFIRDVDVWEDGGDGKSVLAVNLANSNVMRSSWRTINTTGAEKGRVVNWFPNKDRYPLDNSLQCNEIIVNSLDLVTDDDGLHWIFDTGISRFLPLCRPKILAFNSLGEEIYFYLMEGDNVIEDAKIPFIPVSVNTVHTVLETDGKTNGKFHMYIAEPEINRLVVFNRTKFWAISFFEWHIEAIALTLLEENEERELYLQTKSANSIITVPTSKLHGPFGEIDESIFTEYKNIFASPVTSLAISESRILFALHPEEGVISCWNMDQNLNAGNFNKLYEGLKGNVTKIKIFPDRVTKKGEQLYFIRNKEGEEITVDIFSLTIDDWVRDICTNRKSAQSSLTVIPSTNSNNKNMSKWVSELIFASFEMLGILLRYPRWNF